MMFYHGWWGESMDGKVCFIFCVKPAAIQGFTIVYFCAEGMSETAARRTTREKKPSRQYWYDEQDYSNIVTSKTQEQKDKNKVQDQGLLLAKLLSKFVNSSNNKSRNSADGNASQLPNTPHTPSNQDNRASFSYTRKDQSRVKTEHPADQRTGRGTQPVQANNGLKNDPKGRSGKNGKSTQVLSTSLETDLNYHTALNEHVKNAYPNINSLSPDMLRQLSIPTEILSKPAVVRPKSRQEKKGIKNGKDQNKPFKRQSYHVAIAYHIHLKQVKGNRTVEYVDPTFPAKKLREEQAKRL